MIDRYKPNEPTCPVPLDFVAMLLRSNPQEMSRLLLGLPTDQRASLALYCFRRAHMRSLGLAIATFCGEWELGAVGGQAGELLFSQSRSKSRFDIDPVASHKRPVSLARFSA